MPDFEVAPGALRAEASNETDRAQVIEQLSQQIQQARATEDCFGLIGQQAGFFTGYDDMVSAVEEHVRDAAAFLHSVAERLTASADHYQDVDQAHQKLFQQGAEAL
ncbi:type VII secretion target [Goodfellowiella coeruleoviolacea]|uniref:Excreted virulence factor EspC, type VII ESX diderm n=1 Tax=Goodfellowiella coeruleoviolacea TaxID=334858 RepID=A0AAE3GLG1_9PSEU|nr:type VII secretion target [Goodfellowiella coeruleoviolacea]MCP2169725.1 Excreted virulence factor EspC, type VII ESX diderm [Goodfellowiella coeruleoviolacea]